MRQLLLDFTRAPAPTFELASHDGRRVDSAELLAGGPMVLSFFRGSW